MIDKAVAKPISSVSKLLMPSPSFLIFKLMRELFYVNTFPNRVPIRVIYSVVGETYPQEIIKKARALVTEINRKIDDETGVNNLISCDEWRFEITSRYLKN